MSRCWYRLSYLSTMDRTLGRRRESRRSLSNSGLLAPKKTTSTRVNRRATGRSSSADVEPVPEAHREGHRQRSVGRPVRRILVVRVETRMSSCLPPCRSNPAPRCLGRRVFSGMGLRAVGSTIARAPVARCWPRCAGSCRRGDNLHFFRANTTSTTVRLLSCFEPHGGAGDVTGERPLVGCVVHAEPRTRRRQSRRIHRSRVQRGRRGRMR